MYFKNKLVNWFISDVRMMEAITTINHLRSVCNLYNF